MAEIVVCSLIDKLISLSTEEVNLLRDVRGKVLEIKSELVFIRAFLKDADRRAEGEGEINEGVKAWVEDLREVAFKMEDVVDEYLRHMTLQRPNRHQFISFLTKIACFVPKLIPQHHIAVEIRKIGVTVGSIKARSDRYGFTSLPHTSTGTARKRHDPRKASLFLKETEVIGLESQIQELIDVLESPSLEQVVSSVVGMGGLGKTTLVKQVYDRVKGRFDCHAWIAVSEPYKLEDLLRNLIKKFSGGHVEFVTQNAIETMDEDELTNQLRGYLSEKRYLVVLDDVWNKEFWKDIELALPKNQNGARILITTRNKAVADQCRTSKEDIFHEMKRLRPDKAKELFCKKCFQFEYGGCCPPELKNLSAEIVSRCQELPLAIVAVAGILSAKEKSVYQWQKFLESLSSQMMNHSDIERILLLSYNDLPYNLKCCCLYFGMFPKGYSIRCGRLIRQWIAEGFVKPEGGKALEDVAKEYLAELVARSLIEILEEDDEGKTKTCRIHDLLHDVIFKKMGDLSFCNVLAGDNQLSAFKPSTRRLSIIGSSNNILSTPDVSRVRWFSTFNQDEVLNSTLRKFTAKFKLLKVLDFEDNQRLDHLPENIGNLFHLQYLSVRGTRVKLLPKSVEKLINLETLDLKHCLVSEIPFDINKLFKLRHLFGRCGKKTIPPDEPRGIKVKGIEGLKSLQKLYFIEATNTGFGIIEELEKMTQLRTLGITKLRSEDGKSLCGCIEKMKSLESLFVSSTSEEDINNLEFMTSPPEFLRRLYLVGPLRKLPEWVTNLQNLAKITIRRSKMRDDPLKFLGCLRELVNLRILDDAFDGEQLHFEQGGFPKLKALDLSNLKELKSLTIEEGALRVLEKLYLRTPKLQEVPSGIRHLRNLKLLQFLDLPDELMDSMDPKRNHRYQIVCHVASVYFVSYQHGEPHRSYRLRDFGWKPL